MGKNIFETLVGAVVLIVAVGFIVIAYKSGHVEDKGGYGLIAKFDRVDGLSVGSDVRVSGLVVGTVTDATIDHETYLAVINLSIDDKVKLPEDSSAEIIGDGLLGSKYIAIIPGGADEMLEDGGQIEFTQSSISFESLIGKFMFGNSNNNEDSGEGDIGASTKNEDDIF